MSISLSLISISLSEILSKSNLKDAGSKSFVNFESLLFGFSFEKFFLNSSKLLFADWSDFSWFENLFFLLSIVSSFFSF